MKSLPICLFYCQNQIASRFLRPPSKNEPLVIAIPGGPGLSGNYLDHFLIELARHENINVGVMDLPNHGKSVLSLTRLPLSYKNCFDLTESMLNEVAKKTDRIILFGQSFGARLAFDLLSFSHVKIIGGFLTGFPYKFQISERMHNKISLLDMTSDDDNPEENFRKNWGKILPLYTFSPLSTEIFESLVSNTKIRGNEYILDEVPDIVLSMKAFSQKPISPTIGILQGDFDEVVPENNFLKLKNFLPYAQFFNIEKCGHFPMVEKPKETIQYFSQFYSFLEKIK